MNLKRSFIPICEGLIKYSSRNGNVCFRLLLLCFFLFNFGDRKFFDIHFRFFLIINFRYLFIYRCTPIDLYILLDTENHLECSFYVLKTL